MLESSVLGDRDDRSCVAAGKSAVNSCSKVAPETSSTMRTRPELSFDGAAMKSVSTPPVRWQSSPACRPASVRPCHCLRQAVKGGRVEAFARSFTRVTPNEPDRRVWAVCLQLEWEDVRTAFGKSDCAVAANGALQNHPQPQSCHRWASNITATRLRMSTGSPSDRTLHARIRSCILTRTATRTSSGCAQKAL